MKSEQVLKMEMIAPFLSTDIHMIRLSLMKWPEETVLYLLTYHYGLNPIKVVQVQVELYMAPQNENLMQADT
jgi:hypothetical protein